VLLAPFLPETARGIALRIGAPERHLTDLSCARFGAGARFNLKPGPALFPRLERGAATPQPKSQKLPRRPQANP
jgi:methionyl-tRNA synthetase